jgi:hypothetical protein
MADSMAARALSLASSASALRKGSRAATSPCRPSHSAATARVSAFLLFSAPMVRLVRSGARSRPA